MEDRKRPKRISNTGRAISPRPGGSSFINLVDDEEDNFNQMNVHDFTQGRRKRKRPNTISNAGLPYPGGSSFIDLVGDEDDCQTAQKISTPPKRPKTVSVSGGTITLDPGGLRLVDQVDEDEDSDIEIITPPSNKKNVKEKHPKTGTSSGETIIIDSDCSTSVNKVEEKINIKKENRTRKIKDRSGIVHIDTKFYIPKPMIYEPWKHEPRRSQANFERSPVVKSEEPSSSTTNTCELPGTSVTIKQEDDSENNDTSAFNQLVDVKTDNELPPITNIDEDIKPQITVKQEPSSPTTEYGTFVFPSPIVEVKIEKELTSIIGTDVDIKQEETENQESSPTINRDTSTLIPLADEKTNIELPSNISIDKDNKPQETEKQKSSSPSINNDTPTLNPLIEEEKTKALPTIIRTDDNKSLETKKEESSPPSINRDTSTLLPLVEKEKNKASPSSIRTDNDNKPQEIKKQESSSPSINRDTSALTPVSVVKDDKVLPSTNTDNDNKPQETEKQESSPTINRHDFDSNTTTEEMGIMSESTDDVNRDKKDMEEMEPCGSSPYSLAHRGHDSDSNTTTEEMDIMSKSTDDVNRDKKDMEEMEPCGSSPYSLAHREHDSDSNTTTEEMDIMPESTDDVNRVDGVEPRGSSPYSLAHRGNSSDGRFRIYESLFNERNTTHETSHHNDTDISSVISVKSGYPGPFVKKRSASVPLYLTPPIRNVMSLSKTLEENQSQNDSSEKSTSSVKGWLQRIVGKIFKQ